MNWNWIAGFYDARGCLSYSWSWGKKHKLLRIIFIHNDRAMLKKLQEFIVSRDMGEAVHVYPRKKSPNYSKGSPARLVLDGRTAVFFAKEIMPILQSSLKRKQLEKILQLYGVPSK